MPEQIPSTLGATAVLVGGYTAGSGVLSVVSAVGSPPFPASPDFRVVIQDRVNNAIRAVLKVVAINTPQQFGVVPDPVGIDNNAVAGDNVFCVLTEDAFSLLSAVSRTVPLSSAQISGLNAGVAVVPAPGAGKILVFLEAVISYTPGGTPFSDFAVNPATLQFVFDGGTTAIAFTNQDVAFFFTGAAMVAFTAAAPAVSMTTAECENQPLVLIFPSSAEGRITAASVNAGGLGYVAGDTGTIVNAAGGVDAQYLVDTVDGLGAVLTFTVTSPGTGYPVSLGVATVATTGVGVGFTVDITAVQTLGSGNGTANITVTYAIARV